MKIGLVLAGGMAKGAYQIGALRAINNFIPLEEIKYVSCSSVGVLNGYAYASGNLPRAEEMWKSICSDDKKFVITKVLRSSILQQNILELYEDAKTPVNIPFYCSLMDITHRSIVYKDLSTATEEHIPQYLKASVAMPVYNRAVRIGKASYYDGAMIDNIPVYPLLKHDLDYIICIYFDDISYKFENTAFDNKIIKITFPSETMLKHSLIFKQDMIEEMIKTGYERTMFILNSVFADGYENRESVYRAIRHLNKSCTNSSVRITGDMIVTNFNKITQKLTKRKIM